MNPKIIYLILLIGTLVCNRSIGQSPVKLSYNKPAEFFEETLVLGNGKAGGSLFGGIESEKIFLNDITLWTGGPVDPYMNSDAHTNIPAIRNALKNEDYELADQLQKKIQGKFSESYAPLGTLFIDFETQGTPHNYYRELNIAEAISKVNYEINGVEFTREYFISHPDQVMVIKLKSSQKDSLNFDLRFESLLKYQVDISDQILSAHGYVPAYAMPSYLGDDPEAIVFDTLSGTRFSTMFEIKNSDGEITITDSTLGIRGASEALILISTATSFNGFDKHPVTQGLNSVSIAQEQLTKASMKTFMQLKKDHLADYQKYFKRVSLDLGPTTAPDLPTDQRLKRYAEGKEDKNLEILYFQYGRYLLISSSRTPGVPANLQGLWNPYMRPPWSSNYTMNINVEENYWLAENTNLSEMHQPLLSFISNLSQTGAVTAKTFLGVQRGWTACHNSDIWAMSNPVGDFGGGDPVWANWYLGGAWLSTHLWEHYLYTRDLEWLRNDAYSLMRGAAEFCLDWMVEDAKGNLITSPSTSPENRYISDKGYQGATLYGATGELAMIRACLQQCIDASLLLDTDAELRQEMKKAISRLYPYQIGKKGNLQEWYHDWEDVDPKHRHQTHLFGLYPGHQITPWDTPELADACRTTLEIKGDETTGWSKGWRINLWARLGDGNRAYKMVRELMKYVDPDGMKTKTSWGGGTYPNLMDAHPPFQIDGNFGGAAAFAEMLVQSKENEIRILPALPDAWNSGSIEGLCARGGLEISMEWNENTITKLSISSKNDGITRLVYGNQQQDIELKGGQTKIVTWK